MRSTWWIALLAALALLLVPTGSGAITPRGNIEVSFHSKQTTFALNQTETVTFVVKNASNVVVKDGWVKFIPLVHVVNAQPGCTTEMVDEQLGGYCKWQIKGLRPGKKKTYTLRLLFTSDHFHGFVPGSPQYPRIYVRIQAKYRAMNAEQKVPLNFAAPVEG
jgi:hypothetical protein